MNLDNTIDLCRLKEMLLHQKEKRKEIDFQIEILERLISETSKKARDETQKWLSKELDT
ncbi:hypothetical protein QJV38_07120 [Listeria cossartiae subsp. cayugensis]|uniref:Uncharacterized protein n=1 Tax=Listeria cossartiae subsp. cayugensis TaxID=2713505 RepID=A0ABU2IIT4_9LIST|nr:hypothetical protein [Listeria cossartiae]MDT0064585.1 hypothetical protein [Listeria cossartiae subsp. cayugensis]MDT0079811.1 hypothetical protein [Listeria cossartiae subsp. cayugensis]MDT0082647.1 hypothetical protein [Listeria cossartiae subsp. cayugensis]MDT0086818.1 hypothetical protein [Listeria cossartiae subsp. cayugensis]MDT0099264.1 hypothetical protein [Listeria cossartiae subsp. cayugensis]